MNGLIRPRGTFLLLIAFAALIPGLSGAAPKIGGHLEYNGMVRDPDNGGQEVRHSEILHLGMSSPLYYPWIGLLDLGFDLSAVQGERPNDPYRNTLLGGSGQVQLLPRSPFPFTAEAEREDSRTSGDLLGPDRTTTRYRLRQLFSSQTAGSYSLEASRVRQDLRRPPERGGGAVNVSEDLTGSARKTVGSHDLTLDARYEGDRHEATNERFRRHGEVLRHQYRGIKGLSWSNRFSLQEETLSGGSTRTESRFGRVHSNAFWRPASLDRLRLNGSLSYRFRDREQSDLTGVGSANRQSQDSRSGSLGASYLLSPSWQVTGSLAYQEEGGQGEPLRTFRQEGGLRYRTQSLALGAWEYDWGGGVDFSNSLKTGQDSRQQLGLNASHGISRHVELGSAGRFNSRVSQRGSLDFHGMGGEQRKAPGQEITHTLGLDWTRQKTYSRSMLRCQVSDSRRRVWQVSGPLEEEEFQIANLQFSRQQKASALSLLTGSLTVQVHRYAGDRYPEPQWGQTLGADLRYHRYRVLGVDGLRFNSRLNIEGDRQSGSNGIDRDDDGVESLWNRRFWRNKLFFVVGRLQASLEYSVSQYQDAIQQVWFVRLNRQFGRQ